MALKAYHLHKRPTTKKNKFIYYVQFIDESGRRSTARSTGQTSRAAAERWAQAQLKNGASADKRDITFANFAENFWEWGKCKYLRVQHARGKKLSHRYADEMRSLLNHYLLPFFGKYRMRQITRALGDDWLIWLNENPGVSGKHLSATTINRCYACFRIMMNQARKWGFIKEVPIDEDMIQKGTQKERGIYKGDEIKLLFDENSIGPLWDNQLKYFVGNMLPLTTGMRQGEVLGLSVKNVYDGYVDVTQSWTKKYGIGPPKWGSMRQIPIPSKTAFYINQIVELYDLGSENFVFCGLDKNKPLDGKTLLRALYNALEKIGVDAQQRNERGLCYHSWRHTFTTMMRNYVSDVKLRMLTGHTNTRTVDGYTHWTVDDFEDVRQIQEEYFGS